MLKEIQEKINKIMEELHQDLLNTNTIGKNDEIKKPQIFLEIVKEAENKVYKLIKLVEKDGSVINAYRDAANLIFNAQDILTQMKEQMMVKPYSENFSEQEVIKVEQKTPSKFISGIKKFFGKFANRKTKTPQKTL